MMSQNDQKLTFGVYGPGSLASTAFRNVKQRRIRVLTLECPSSFGNFACAGKLGGCCNSFQYWYCIGRKIPKSTTPFDGAS